MARVPDLVPPLPFPDHHRVRTPSCAITVRDGIGFPADRVVTAGPALRADPPRAGRLPGRKDPPHPGHRPHDAPLEVLRERHPLLRPAGQHDHRVRRADAVHVLHQQAQRPDLQDMRGLEAPGAGLVLHRHVRVPDPQQVVAAAHQASAARSAAWARQARVVGRHDRPAGDAERARRRQRPPPEHQVAAIATAKTERTPRRSSRAPAAPGRPAARGPRQEQELRLQGAGGPRGRSAARAPGAPAPGPAARLGPGRDRDPAALQVPGLRAEGERPDL